MYNFDGEYRRTKEQNLAGASKLASGKDELISRAHKERMKRQMERKRETSAVRIQKVIRGFLCRLRLKKKFNLEFGECLQLCKHRQTMPSDVQYLIARLHFISHAGICKQHLEDVTRKALSISNDIIKLAAKDSSWIWRLNILLTYCLKIIHLNPANLPLEESVLLMCNALETFTALNDNATPITIKKSSEIVDILMIFGECGGKVWKAARLHAQRFSDRVLPTYKECIKVVREVYQRNERCQMVNESDWHSFLLPVPDNGLHCFTDLQDNVRIYPPFTNYRTDLLDASSTHTIGSWCDRACTLLTSLPFTIPFNKRCRMLWNVLSSELHGYQNPDMHFLQIPHISTTIRRGYIYEDSFEKFSIDSAPELKIAIRIRFTNALNMEEAGIDGGGIFREFITDLLKTAFDPNRGFFILTKDNKLYPNPNVATVYPNFTSHYFFIGRMLAKAIFENIIVDIPLAEFFLSKIIDTASLYPSMLYTLDKDLFKNISYIRTSIDDYSTLGLDFTTTTSSFGSSTVVELKKNGADIPVNKDNVIEYLHLISKQKLHSDISKQTRAFTKGLGNVLPLHMVRMFTPREIQLIISGDHSPIDLSDLQKNVIYTGGFSSSHETIKMFWNVLDSFTDLERRQMLKFVTSCTRPPLRGFKDLHPPFCIQLAEGMDNRLPTASTCMNILKLPIYTDEATMKEKLLYAIQSGAGFELS
uniref:HECT-type E3 ubiquitin transferase n=1 Tax=Rhodnius prolixus TaxID=13249 RepID=T1HA92_RHOPR